MIASILAPLLTSSLLAKILGSGAVLAYIYSLYARYQAMCLLQAQNQVQTKVKTDLEKIAEAATHVTETEKDYSNAVDNFKRNNP